jgi:hypothetical protein
LALASAGISGMHGTTATWQNNGTQLPAAACRPPRSAARPPRGQQPALPFGVQAGRAQKTTKKKLRLMYKKTSPLASCKKKLRLVTIQ